jgi:hypothetical protein
MNFGRTLKKALKRNNLPIDLATWSAIARGRPRWRLLTNSTPTSSPPTPNPPTPSPQRGDDEHDLRVVLLGLAYNAIGRLKVGQDNRQASAPVFGHGAYRLGVPRVEE